MIDHALFTRNILPCEESKFLKLDVVLVHGHASLLEIVELLTLALSNTCWNMMSFEASGEIIPGNHTTSSGIFVLLIPISSLVLGLKRIKLDKVLRPDIATFKILTDVHEPIIGVSGLNTVAERLRLICKELVEGSKLRLIVEFPLTLISLVVFALVALLQELQKHLGVGVGGCHDSLPCLRRRRWWRRVRLTPFIAFRIQTRWWSHPEEGDIH